MRIEIYVTAGPAKGKYLAFDKPDCFLFGRAGDAHISVPTDQYVSRQHFLLEISPPNCTLKDLNSKNGVIVNGVRYGGHRPPSNGIKQAPDGVKEVQIKHGDEIVVGATRMKVLIRDLPIGAPAAVQPPPTAPQSVRCSLCGKEMPDGAAAGAQLQKTTAICQTCLEKIHQEEVRKMLNAATAPPPETQQAAPSSKVPFTIPGYQISHEMKHEGTGTIYKAYTLQTGQIVAIKTLLSQAAIDAYTLKAFRRELDIFRQLKHRNLVQFIQHGEAEGRFYFVFEFVDGMDLAQFLKMRGKPLSIAEALPLWRDILDGLAYAHGVQLTLQNAQGEQKIVRGIVHRNLKPQSILLARQGDTWVPKITDFGLAKSFESAGLTDITVPGDVLGTPIYWPREQITHYRHLNPATDVFSIAAVFYEMLTGSWVRHGFKELFRKCKQQKRMPSLSDYMTLIAASPAIPLQQRKPDCPEPIARVIDRALQEAEIPHDIQQMHAILERLRYPDAGAFQEALRKACEEAGLAQFWNPDDSQTSPDGQKNQIGSAAPAAIMYSNGRVAEKRDVALMVLDLVGSTQYLLHKGDTDFSTLIGSMLRRVKKLAAATDLILLKSTGDGFLAVIQTAAQALSLALTFLHRPLHPDVQVRIAVHWGTVTTGPDNDVLGTEVRRVYRVESVGVENRLEPLRPDELFPTANRILATREFIAQIPDPEKFGFRSIGTFRLNRTGQADCELWVITQ